jgi:hypothetical protein
VNDYYFFFQLEPEWKPIYINGKRKFKKTGTYIPRNWEMCTISAVKIDEKTIKMIVRRKTNQYSSYMQRRVKITFMLSFEISEIPHTIIENSPIVDSRKKMNQTKKIMVLRLKKNTMSEDIKNKWCYIWDWIDENQDIHNHKIYRLYQELTKMYNSPINNQVVFPIIQNNNDNNKEKDRFVPVIYQPSMDSWKNFIRQIHCYYDRENNEYNITLIFNNEQLRKNKLLSSVYLKIRQLLHKRLDDVETFKIKVDNNNDNGGIFKGIYSGKYDLEYDSIHEDKGWLFRKVPIRKIHYYYTNNRHPIIFINTSNHAMAQHDNNPHLWKWEYCGWEEDSPIILGDKLTRSEIDKILRKLDKEELIETIKNKAIKEKVTLSEKDPSIFKEYIQFLKREHLISEKLAEEDIEEVKKELLLLR